MTATVGHMTSKRLKDIKDSVSLLDLGVYIYPVGFGCLEWEELAIGSRGKREMSCSVKKLIVMYSLRAEDNPPEACRLLFICPTPWIPAN